MRARFRRLTSPSAFPVLEAAATAAGRVLGLGLVAAGLIAQSLALGGCARADVRQSFIILDIDTLRADHLGCYGYRRDTSPNLDAMAKGGVRFRWAFSQAPYTPPSQTSILTSLYPSTHGVFGEITKSRKVPDEVTTLAEAMRDGGYQTAAFVDGGYMCTFWNIHQGFNVYDVVVGKGLAVIGPRTLSWLRDNSSRPFFLLVHTYNVHSPYDPGEAKRSLFQHGLDPPSPDFELTTANLSKLMNEGRRGKRNQLPANDIEFMKARYDACIRFVDDWIGRLFEELRRLGIDDRTTIVLLSDHGEEFQEHGSVLHEKLYSTITHIPLIFKLPDATQARVIDQVVQSIDVMPTILDLAGVPPPATPMHGRSLVPLLRGQSLPPRPAFGESLFFGRQRSLVDGSFQLLLALDNRRVELYNLRWDPLQQHNLRRRRPEIVQRMTEQLMEQQQALESQVLFPPQEDRELSPEVGAQLEALGYVESKKRQ